VRADFYVIAVKTTAAGGHHGISFLVVDRQDSIHASKLEKLGWHASDTAELAFEEVFVPDDALLGHEHGGFALIMADFPVGAAADGARRGGAMHLALERAVGAATEGGARDQARRLATRSRS